MKRVVDPTGVMASTSSVGVAPHSSPNAPAMSRSNDSSPGDMASKTAPMNPLLLASVCFGSSAALEFLFRREDAQEPPMVMPTQEFLDLLVGYTLGNSTRGRLTVLAPDDVELGIYQSVSSCSLENGIDQFALPVAAARLIQGVTAEGNTALHAVASHGDSTEFQKCARIISERGQDLLFAINRKGDTPMHCAARAGKSQVLSCLIELARSCDRLHELLRKENGLKETPLHDAVRIGRKDIVELLLGADPDLANYPEEGTSPLYLAISLKRDIIAHTLHDKSNGNLSYHGPNGRNGLHAAILQGIVITEDLLKWKSSLTTQGDKDGSTPLHFASSLHRRLHQPSEDYNYNTRSLWHSNIFRKVFEANPAPVYQADSKGSFHVHIAASLGAEGTVAIILEKCPSSAGLRTAQGQTFLHVAVEKRRSNIVSFVCRTPSLASILNMQDNDGNTALHLAIKDSSLRIFGSLYGNMEVHLSLRNNNEETPADLSRSYLTRGMHYNWNNDKRIHVALAFFGSNHNAFRWDQYKEKYSRQLNAEDKVREAEKVKDSSQILGIGSVLIATMAFSATFAVPGGFIADDHTNRGAPTLAGRYTFDAFMMANALAFICSSTATIGIMFSGSPLLNLNSRQANLSVSTFLISSSVTSLSAAFALGVYMVLAPVAHATAIAICVLSPLVVLYRNFEFTLKAGILAWPICIRTGLSRGLKWLASMIVSRMLIELWPFVLIFGWAAIAQKLRNHL